MRHEMRFREALLYFEVKVKSCRRWRGRGETAFLYLHHEVGSREPYYTERKLLALAWNPWKGSSKTVTANRLDTLANIFRTRLSLLLVELVATSAPTSNKATKHQSHGGGFVPGMMEIALSVSCCD